MDKLFYPESIAIIGLSSKANNIPRLVLENLIRWGFKGRIFGINPASQDAHVNGIRMYQTLASLPAVPDLVFALVPARYIPAIVEECGKIGVKWMAIPSGGFNELGGDGAKLADQLVAKAREYGIRFVGPNGVTVANTANGLCLPFIPSFSPPKGGMSIISQSGGVGLMLWNFMSDENVGMAKFASIGNKLDLDEVDFLEYFGRDPETKIIGMYLESIPRGEALLRAASRIDKPIIILKSNTTPAGKKAAMSHTAALSNDEDIIDSAFERAGIIRIGHFNEFISVAKAFDLPPMRGNRIMVMSPAGGITVMMADLCEKIGFEFANPGPDFYESLKKYSNAGVINFSNPLDMGDIYNMEMYAHIFYSVLHNDSVDGVVYVSQWPHMPRGEDIFYKMFHTDLSKEATGSMLSSGKPLAACLFGRSKTISQIKRNINFPIFNSAEEMIVAMKKQAEFHARRERKAVPLTIPADIDREAAREWMRSRAGDFGEESLALFQGYGIGAAPSALAADENAAADAAAKLGFPAVMKVVSPDALHKTDAGGVITGIDGAKAAKEAFGTIRSNLERYKPGARFDGVRVMPMAGPGYDMFIGGTHDASFGPVVFFGYGGIYIEVFRDTANVLCPARPEEVARKLAKLRSAKILGGMRGKPRADVDSFVDMIVRVSHLLADFPSIKELDLNPVRLPEDGSRAIALDARIRIG
ncbi:MAG: hypothetical protein EPN93_20415 [Spirochaetes bacterium]|nr:MAG: hypothetical protein EPN93_20415 [Spirochaetota bacterium]